MAAPVKRKTSTGKLATTSKKSNIPLTYGIFVSVVAEEQHKASAEVLPIVLEEDEEKSRMMDKTTKNGSWFSEYLLKSSVSNITGFSSRAPYSFRFLTYNNKVFLLSYQLALRNSPRPFTFSAQLDPLLATKNCGENFTITLNSYRPLRHFSNLFVSFSEKRAPSNGQAAAEKKNGSSPFCCFSSRFFFGPNQSETVLLVVILISHSFHFTFHIIVVLSFRIPVTVRRFRFFYSGDLKNKKQHWWRRGVQTHLDIY